jgi:hypothetical protein
MRGVYTSAAKAPAITTAGTLAYLTAPANKVVEILAVTVTNESNATNYQMEIQLCPIVSVGLPSNYTSVAPQQHEAGDQNAGTSGNLAKPSCRPGQVQRHGFGSDLYTCELRWFPICSDPLHVITSPGWSSSKTGAPDSSRCSLVS